MSREKAIESPERLYELFTMYKRWAKSTPYKWHDYVGKDATEVWKERERPLTWIGFEGWMAKEGYLTQLGHYEHNTNDSYTEFLPIIRVIKQECRQDTIEGALSGVYNQNIAARLEGLADKKEVDKKITKLDFRDAE